MQEFLGGDRIPHVQRVAGASAGAINALLVGLGYSIEEMKTVLATTDLREYLDDVDLRERFFELKENMSLSKIFQDGSTAIKTYKKLKGTVV